MDIKHDDHHRFALYLLVCLAFFLFVLFGYFSVAPYPQAGDTTVSSESVSTVSWKTYRNEKYGFEVKYPSEMKIFSIDFTDSQDIKAKGFASPSPDSSALLRVYFGWPAHTKYSSHGYTLSIEKAGAGNIDFWLNKLSDAFLCKIIDARDITVAGVSAKKWQVEGGCEAVDRGIVFVRGGKVYFFTYNGWLDDEEEIEVRSMLGSSAEVPQAAINTINVYREPYRVYFDQILSTFKFISTNN